MSKQLFFQWIRHSPQPLHQWQWSPWFKLAGELNGRKREERWWHQTRSYNKVSHWSSRTPKIVLFSHSDPKNTPGTGSLFCKVWPSRNMKKTKRLAQNHEKLQNEPKSPKWKNPTASGRQSTALMVAGCWGMAQGCTWGGQTHGTANTYISPTYKCQKLPPSTFINKLLLKIL